MEDAFPDEWARGRREGEIPIEHSFDHDPAKAAAIRSRIEQGEFWLAVDEDWGWREWIWLPGMPKSEFLHWWVTRATCSLPGEFVPALPHLADYYSGEAFRTSRFTAHVECTRDTCLALPDRYRATLLPACGQGIAEASCCSPSGEDFDSVQQKWALATHLAQTSAPQEYWTALERELTLINAQAAHPAGMSQQ